MTGDAITPIGFDLLLLSTASLLAIAVLILTISRIRRFLRRHRASDLSGVIASLAWILVSIAFITRPLAELWPDTFTNLERIVGPAARLGCLIVALVLWLYEREGHDEKHGGGAAQDAADDLRREEGDGRSSE